MKFVQTKTYTFSPRSKNAKKPHKTVSKIGLQKSIHFRRFKLRAINW